MLKTPLYDAINELVDSHLFIDRHFYKFHLEIAAPRVYLVSADSSFEVMLTANDYNIFVCQPIISVVKVNPFIKVKERLRVSYVKS